MEQIEIEDRVHWLHVPLLWWLRLVHSPVWMPLLVRSVNCMTVNHTEAAKREKCAVAMEKYAQTLFPFKCVEGDIAAVEMRNLRSLSTKVSEKSEPFLQEMNVNEGMQFCTTGPATEMMFASCNRRFIEDPDLAYEWGAKACNPRTFATAAGLGDLHRKEYGCYMTSTDGVISYQFESEFAKK